MKVGYKKLGVVLGAVVAVAFMPERADAQFVRYSPVFWSFEAGGGVALPLGDLADVSSSGASIVIGGSYFLNPNFALRAEGGLDFLGAGDTAGANDPGNLPGINPPGSTTGADADLQVWHYTGGFEWLITDPTGGFFFSLDVMGGGVTFDSEAFNIQDYPGPGNVTLTSFSSTFAQIGGGLKLGFSFARHEATDVPIATIYLNGDFHYMFTTEEKTAAFAAWNGVQPFGGSMLLPITAGIRFNIP